jgi:hypothetical protein
MAKEFNVKEFILFLVGLFIVTCLFFASPKGGPASTATKQDLKEIPPPLQRRPYVNG